ncbi:MAG TPA: LytTR family DNA-binding domain-containing protein [Ideonella sp.]|nr:LytTR family DNA-binding domain-containing protein [Ideonella sp.]
MKPGNTYRTLIAEDEPLASEGLAEWVRQLPQLELVASAADGASALRAIRELQPDLVLMDIQMPGMTGLQVLRELAADDEAPAPAVIFTTAYDEHALAAFELHAVDYLLKPFAQERFNEAVLHVVQRGAALGQALPALEAAQKEEAEPLTRLLVRDGARIVPLLVDEIEHFRSDTKYTAVTSKGRSYLVRLPISEFEKRLDPKRFLKVNRSCLVNLDFVDLMTPGDGSQYVIRLRDGSSVTASREVSKHLRSVVL